MPEFKFKNQNEKTPEFDTAGTSFRLTLTPGFISIEYCGSSSNPREYEINMIIKSENHLANKTFIYTFCIFDSWYEIPFSEEEKIEEISININENNKDMPFMGMVNLGATCYINSLLQSMYFLPEMKKYIYSGGKYYSFLFKRLFYQLDRANSEIKNAEKKEDDSVYTNTSGLIKNLPFVSSVNSQQDVHEFSKILFDKLENEDDRLKNIIEGKLISTIECSCGCVSKRADPFQDISMALKIFGAEGHSLKESLEIFCKEEELSGYKCEKHGEVNAKKKVRFGRLPEVLFVLINRFRTDWENGEYVKDNDYYTFPEEIDFEQYCEEMPAEVSRGRKSSGNTNDALNNKAEDSDTIINPNTGTSIKAAKNEDDLGADENEAVHERETKYKLYSVIIHSGMVDKGHFYCYLNLDGKYYKFNDWEVYECSKEEAVDWNFGGSYAYNKKRRKHFSAYYLIYRKQFRTSVDFNSVAVLKEFFSNGSSEFTFEDLTAPRNTIFYNYIANSHVAGYNGPGCYNTTDYAYPLTIPSANSCFLFDNISKVFMNYSVYDEDFNLLGDLPVLSNKTYFLTEKRKKGVLVFLKSFTPAPWCGYPLFFNTLCSTYISSFSDINKYADSDTFQLFIEKENSVHALKGFSEIRNGDVIIISTSADVNINEFYKDFINYEFINVCVNTFSFPLFVKKNLSLVGMEEVIQENLLTQNIFIIKKDVSVENEDTNVPKSDVTEDIALKDGSKLSENPVAKKSCMNSRGGEEHNDRSSFIDAKQRVNCFVKSGIFICIGAKVGFDINHTSHVHPILIPENSTVASFIKQLRSSKFICMDFMQSNEEIQIIESFKDSFNVRILQDTDMIEQNGGFLVVGKKIENPLKIVFFTGAFGPSNYPFFIENPGSVASLRQNMFFTNKIVRFNGEKYHECDMDEQLDLDPCEILLIQK